MGDVGVREAVKVQVTAAYFLFSPLEIIEHASVNSFQTEKK